LTVSLIDLYCAAWNANDKDKRDALLASCWADYAVYNSPVHHARSRSALSEHIAKFHADQPGAFLKRASGVDGHSGYVRFQWTLHDSEGLQIAEGTSFGRISETGQIEEMTGFFGPFPELG